MKRVRENDTHLSEAGSGQRNARLFLSVQITGYGSEFEVIHSVF